MLLLFYIRLTQFFVSLKKVVERNGHVASVESPRQSVDLHVFSTVFLHSIAVDSDMGF